MIITGTPGSETLIGTPDDDVIDALDGSDIVFAGSGNDTISGGPGGDVLDGGAGDDIIHGDDGGDSFQDSTGRNTLFGDGGNDIFEGLGNTGQDGTTADGGTGNDIFDIFGASNFTITTGAGSDRIAPFFADTTHKVTITDFTAGAGGDIIDLQFLQLTGWDFRTNPFGSGFFRLAQNGADTDLQWDKNGLTGGLVWTTFVTLQNVTAAAITKENFVPNFAPDGSAPTITGTPGNDLLIGTAQGDIINALDGADIVNAGAGDDTVSGGLGNDLLDGQADNDLIHGDDGDDSITGGTGSNTLFGDAGNDIFQDIGVVAQDGTTADGGSGNDLFSTFGSSNVTITTGTGSDKIQLIFADTSHKLTVTDFTAGAGGDLLDIFFILGSLTGWDQSTNPFAAGFLRLVQNGADTDLQWDKNGPTGGAAWSTFVTLQNVTASTLLPANFFPQHTSNVFSPLPAHGVGSDFNADGLGDLFLFSDRGASAIWFMNGSQRLGGGGNLPFNGPTWHVKAAADLDSSGPGFSDLVWQNDNGLVAVWQMNGSTVVGQASLLNPGATTKVIGARDFDGNGGADILLQGSDGRLSLWFMQDATHIATNGQTFVAQNPGPAWHARAIGDFDGDGRPGVIFTMDDGATAVWDGFVMNGNNQGQFLFQGNLLNNGPTWHVKATGDFDGDGKDDILWQNDSGLASIWLMDGIGIKAGFNIAGTDANGPTWHIANARDMNADGRADILWQNDNGAVALWENFVQGPGNSATFSTQLNVTPNVNPDGHLFWHVL